MPMYHEHNLLSYFFPKGDSRRYSPTALMLMSPYIALEYLFPTELRQ